MPYGSNFKTYEKKNYKKVEFINLATGTNIIRILSSDAEAVVLDTHFLSGVTVKCVDSPEVECPVCKNNALLRAKYGKEAINQEGYSSKRQVCYLNVYDRTPVKVCPSCGVKNKANSLSGAFPNACSGCGGTILKVPVTPLNEVKVLSKGKEIMDQIDALAVSTLNAEGEALGITNFDIKYMVIPSSGKRKTSALSAITENTDVVTVESEQLFDLKRACFELSAEELADLMKGVSLRDILAARKAEVVEEAEEPSPDGIASSKKVYEEMKDLFN